MFTFPGATPTDRHATRTPFLRLGQDRTGLWVRPRKRGGALIHETKLAVLEAPQSDSRLVVQRSVVCRPCAARTHLKTFLDLPLHS
ncbi:hypothetical protein AOLI_G00302150 [Acnodon oligacanthus]